MIFIVIYLTCFEGKEPEDECLCKAVLILINTHIQNPRCNIKATLKHTRTLPYITWVLIQDLKTRDLKTNRLLNN